MRIASFRRTAALASGLLVVSVLGVSSAHAGLLPIPCDPTTMIGDCTPPTTTINSEPASSTTETTATFTFSTPEDNATFQCWLSGPSDAHVWRDCTGTPQQAGESDGSSSYANLVPGSYEFQVRGTDSVGNVENPPVSYDWTVTSPDPSTPPPNDPNTPDTTLTLKPHYWHLFTYASFAFKADKPIDHFSCTLDGKSVNCPASDSTHGSVDLYPGAISAGTHVFKVSAVDAQGRLDQTPARSLFTRPRTVVQLKNWSRGWTKSNGHGYFTDAYAETTRHNAWVHGYSRGVLRAAVIATKCPGCGQIDIFWNGDLVKHVNLRTPKRHQRQVIPVVSFKRRHDGQVKVVVTSKGKTVIIEGMGFATHR